MKQYEISICNIDDGHGGPVVHCGIYKLLSNEDMSFILKHLVHDFDTYFNMYPLNKYGMHYIEKLGYGSNYGIEQKYFDIRESTKTYFNLKDFMNGAYKTKFYNKGVEVDE